ncbi:MAG: DUF2726 domain-containing protein [Spirochaetales bacterium]|nr:DUF2726 domain-containing protein [Spirochaetales bacterium]
MNEALKKIINTSEYLTRDIIEKAIDHTNYYLLSQTPMYKVIDAKVLELSKTQKKHYQDSSFDFIIVNKKGYAVLVIEFDGPIHLTSDVQMKADLTKVQICSFADLPLLRIDDSYINIKEKISILEYLIIRFNNWNIKKKELKNTFEKYMSSLSKEEQDKVIEKMDYYDYLPDVVFNYKYQFAEMIGVTSEIENEIGLTDENSLFIENMKKSNYGYRSSSPIFSDDGRIQFIVTYHINIVAAKGEKRINVNEDISENENMKWYVSDEKQIGHRLFINCSFHYDILGTSIPDLCENIAKYKCLKKILEKCREYKNNGWNLL